MTLDDILAALEGLSYDQLNIISCKTYDLQKEKSEDFNERCKAIIDQIYELRKDYSNSCFFVSEPTKQQWVDLLTDSLEYEIDF